MLRWFLFFPIYVFSVLFVWMTACFWARLSVRFNWTTLPGILSYLHTTDDDLDGGQHQLGWPVVTGKDLVKQRTAWLRRNPAGGIASYVLGIPVSETKVTYTANSGLFDTGTALRKAILLYKDREYFEYRRDFQWCPWFYAKMWFGWTTDIRAGYHRFQFQFNPFRKMK